MLYRCLICDYDGTIADRGVVAPDVVHGLERIRDAGWKVVLATGRILTEIEALFPKLYLFDRIVAENGAVLFRPDTREEIVLADPPPVTFIDALRKRKVDPLVVGRVIVGTEKPQDIHALEVIREMGLERTLIFNKHSVMVLPSGVNKATALDLALQGLGLTFEQSAGVGDAENDHAFLKACGYSAALANAVDSLKSEVDWVADLPNGRGVLQVIEKLLAPAASLQA